MMQRANIADLGDIEGVLALSGNNSNAAHEVPQCRVLKLTVMVVIGGQRSAGGCQRGTAVRQDRAGDRCPCARIPVSGRATPAAAAASVASRSPCDARAGALPSARLSSPCMPSAPQIFLKTVLGFHGFDGCDQSIIWLCSQAAQGEDALLGRSASSGGSGGRQRLL